MKVCLLAMCSLLLGPSAAGQDAAPTDDPEAVSLLGRPLHRPALSDEQLATLQRQLDEAQAAYDRDPTSVDAIVWLGRRLAYLWRYQEAVEVFSTGIERYPDEPRLYRHRGHRYITLRKFELAERDLAQAARLIEDTADEVEPDGAPNAAGIPTSTLHTNVWYHLGLARFLQGRFESALEAYQECLAASHNNDMRVATLDWMYMTLRRLGRKEEADAMIAEVRPDWDILENFSYHRRIQMYQGLIAPDELLRSENDAQSSLDMATQGFGVAHWYLVEGESRRARAILEQVIEGDYWAAFGHIAAEAEIARGEK